MEDQLSPEQRSGRRELKETDKLRGGRYKIVKKLSAMNSDAGGCVYLAETDLAVPSGTLSYNVAIKQVYEDLHNIFDNEVNMLAKLKSRRGVPYLIESFYASEYKSWILVMEYIGGDTLETLYSQGQRLEVRRILDWACDILNTLEWLHANKFVHRDIKLANIKIPNPAHSDTILLDFGFTKLLGETSLSPDGATKQYAAPEQIQPKLNIRTEARSDLYSLAATLYVLLAGDENKLWSAAERLKGNVLLSLRQHRSIEDVPDEVVEIIDRALSLDIDKRPNSAAEMREILQAARERLPSPSFPMGTLVGSNKVTRVIDCVSTSATYEGRSADGPDNTRATLRYFVPGSQPDASSVAVILERGNSRQPDAAISSLRAVVEDKTRKGMWYVFDHVPGKPLGDNLSTGYNFGRVVTWLDQALAILGNMHTNYGVFGSVHPWSIVVDTDDNDRLQLLDWGILITAHTVAHFDAYVAPEVRGGATPTIASDIWSLSKTFYELCGSILAPNSIESLLNDVPRFEAVLQQGMEADPAERFPSTQAMQQALQPFIQVERLRTQLAKDASDTLILVRVDEQPNPLAPEHAEPETIVPTVLTVARALNTLHDATEQVDYKLDWSLSRHSIEVKDGDVKLLVTADSKHAESTHALMPQHQERELLADCLPSELLAVPRARDFFLLAAIAYYLLTEQPPASANERQRITQLGGRDPLLPVDRVRNTIPPDIADALTSALTLPPQASDLAAWQNTLVTWFRPLEPWNEVYERRRELASTEAGKHIIVYANKMEPAFAEQLSGFRPITEQLASCSAVFTMVQIIATVLDTLHKRGVVYAAPLHTGVYVQHTTGQARLLLDLSVREMPGTNGAPIAPELRRAIDHNNRTNQFNLAVITFFALTGSWPSVRGSDGMINFDYLDDDLKRSNARFKRNTKGISATARLLQVAMSPEPEQRYEHCEVFASHLRRAMERDNVLER